MLRGDEERFVRVAPSIDGAALFSVEQMRIQTMFACGGFARYSDLSGSWELRVGIVAAQCVKTELICTERNRAWLRSLT